MIILLKGFVFHEIYEVIRASGNGSLSVRVGIGMKQYNYGLKNKEIFDRAISEMKERQKEGGNLLILLFHGSDDPAFIEKDLDRLADAFPGVPLCGETSSGGILDGHQAEGVSILSFLFFEKTEISLSAFEIDPMALTDAARRVLDLYSPVKDLSGIAILGSIPVSTISPFLKALDALPPSVSIFGGLADSCTEGGRTFVFDGRRILENAILCIAFTGPVVIDVQTNLGWQPLGQEMTITAMTGDHVIKEIDYEPAEAVYARYLGIEDGEDMETGFLSFPLLVIENDRFLARLPDDFLPDGALSVMGNCREGQKVHLSYGNPNEIISCCQENAKKLEDFAPEGLLIFSCVIRRLFLNEGTDQGLVPYGELAPMAGGYCHGEISREGGITSSLNMTLVAAALRENSHPDAPHKVHFHHVGFKSNTMTTIQRMASFMTVSSVELEKANDRLEEMNRKLTDTNNRLAFLATHDGLTGLFDREAIETRLRRLTNSSRSMKVPFFAIMMDLDNFKAINDTFGYDVGDRVLKELAMILKNEMTPFAAAGRWGGDEFVLLLPNLTPESTLELAETLRKSVSQKIFCPDGTPVSISLGIARSGPKDKAENFYRRMDKALYVAKRSGKNTVAVVKD